MQTLVYGSFPLIQEEFIAHIRKIRAESPLSPVTVLVPNRLLRFHLQRTLADAGRPHANIRFMTFPNLAEELAGDVMRRKGRSIAPKFFSELALEGIIQNNLNRLDYFRPVAEKEGFRHALLRTFADLKEAGLTPDSAETALGVIDRREDSRFLAKLAEVLSLWRALESLHARTMQCDTIDLLRLAAEQASDSLWLARQSELILYGIYDMNGLQRTLVDACMATKPASVFMPYGESSAFRYATALFKWFQAHGFTVSPAQEKRNEPPQTDLNALQSNLFGEIPENLTRHDAGKGFLVVSAPGEEREAEEILRETIHAPDWAEGEPPPSTGILLRSREPYGELMAEVMQQAGVKGCCVAGPSLAATVPARALLQMTRLAASPMKRADVMEFLTSAPLKDPHAADKRLTSERVTAWDQISIEAGIIEGESSWLSRLDALANRAKRETDHGDNEHSEKKISDNIAEIRALREHVATLFKRWQKLRTMDTWSAMTAEIEKMFGEIILTDDTADKPLDSLRDLGRLDGTGISPSMPLLHSLLKRALEEQKPPAHDFGRVEPLVADLMEARGVIFDTVILPGMVEKSFPRPHRQDPILLDAERKILSTACKKNGTPIDLPLKRETAAEEELLFALAVGCARRRLILTYPRIDTARGRPRIGSRFLLRCVEAVTGNSCDYETLDHFIRNDAAGHFVRFSRQDSTVRDRAVGMLEYDLSSLGKAHDENTPDALLYCTMESPFFARVLKAENARWGSERFSEYDGVITQSNSLKKKLGKTLHDPDRPVSPTRMEDYAKCPFAYLLKHVMGLEAIEEPEQVAEISALDRGSLIHGIFWEFMSETAANGPANITLDDWPRLEAIAHKRFDQAERIYATGYPLVWRVEQERMMEDLRESLAQEASDESDYKPAWFEVRFGMRSHDSEESGQSTETPVPFEPSPGETILFRGKIDRVDLAAERSATRIVDYKSGRAPKLKKNSFDGGCALQLPIYIVAAQHLFKETPPEEAQYYYPTRRGEWKRISFDTENWSEKSKTLGKILQTILDGIRNGLFYARLASDRCNYCDARTACGHGRLLEFKWNADARCSAFNEMTEIE